MRKKNLKGILVAVLALMIGVKAVSYKNSLVHEEEVRQYKISKIESSETSRQKERRLVKEHELEELQLHINPTTVGSKVPKVYNDGMTVKQKDLTDALHEAKAKKLEYNRMYEKKMDVEEFAYLAGVSVEQCDGLADEDGKILLQKTKEDEYRLSQESLNYSSVPKKIRNCVVHLITGENYK